jgi:hypothetical protein
MKNNTYKKGGGYFPEYNSFAPPRMANGGGLLSRKVTCSNCGWSWKAVEGGKDPMTCHKCGGMAKMQNGGMLDKFDVGGPGPKNKTNPPIYTDNLKDPRIRAYADSLRLYNNSLKDLKNRGSNNLEARFKPNDPLVEPLRDMWKGNIQPTSIEQYSGGYEGRGTAFIPRYKKPVQPVVYKKLTQPGPKIKDDKTLPNVNIKKEIIYTDNKNDPRLKAYNDSLNLYKAMQMQDKLMGKGSEISKYKLDKNDYTKKQLKEARKIDPKYGVGIDYQNEKEFREESKKDNRYVRPEDIKLLNYYKSLGFNDDNIMYHQSLDIASDKIRPVGSYFDGTAYSPVFKKPVQPVVYKKPDPVLQPGNRETVELAKVTRAGVPQLAQGPNMQVQQRGAIQNLPYQVDWRMNNEDRTNYFPSEKEGAEFLKELNPITGLPEYRNRGDYNASGRYTVADKLRGLKQGGSYLPKAQTGLQTNIINTTTTTIPPNPEKQFVTNWNNSPMAQQMLQASVNQDDPLGRNSAFVKDITNARNILTNKAQIKLLPKAELIREYNSNSNKTKASPGLGGFAGNELNKPKAFGSTIFNMFTTPFVANMIGNKKAYYAVDAHNVNAVQPKIYTNSDNLNQIPETNVHELSHASDFNGLLIPDSDVKKMDMFARGIPGGYSPYLNDFQKYVAKPTETRARLTGFRYNAANQKLYNPFTEKITLDQLKKYKSTSGGYDPLLQLREVYSDPEIVNLLNSISKTNQNSQSNNAAYGGSYLPKPETSYMKNSKKKEGGDISIADLNLGNWLSKYKESSKRFDVGGLTCGKGQVRFADENGERCIDINSQEYKDIYTKGIGTFQKYDKSKNKWVSATQDDTDAVFTTSKDNLSEVTVKGKFDPAKRAEYLKKQQERLIGSTTPNYNVSESTRNQPMIDLSNRDREQQEIINNWKKRNPYGASLSDVEVQDRIARENTMRSKNDSLRELTPQEIQKSMIDSENREWQRKTFGVFAGGTEGEKIERWRKEDEEHNAAVAETNSAILAKDNNEPFTFPTGVTKKWSEMDGREKAYVIGIAQSRDLKLFPGATADETLKTTLDQFNPFPILNDWTKGFTTAPYVARETDSYMPYVAAVADPAITIGAVIAGQPELTVNKALTTKIFNWKKPIQDIGKAMAASREGELISYGADKLRKDEIKNIGKEINSSLKTDVGNTSTEKQLAQLKNTPSNQGVNSLGLFNPNTLKNLTTAGLSVIPFPRLKKYGGSTKKMKNWTDKYK